MKAVIQRVTDAAVTVNGALKGSIAYGLLVYLGVARDDTTQDADWLIEKIPHLRIFDDQNGKMNLSLLDFVNQQKEVVNKKSVNHEKEVVNTTRHLTEAHRTFGSRTRRPRGFLKLFNSLRVLRAPRASVRVSSTSPIGVLAVSQFTLLGDARKGRRPTWDKAAPPEKARELYRYFIEKMGEKVPCESGEFQAHMKVTYTNDGPVTILLDSK
jgi:D-tyrosyl-tRNA(Tyr) deacylase